MIKLTNMVFRNNDFKTGIMKVFNTPGVTPKSLYTIQRVLDKLRPIQFSLEKEEKKIRDEFFADEEIPVIEEGKPDGVRIEKTCLDELGANAALEALYTTPIEIELSQIDVEEIMPLKFLSGEELFALEPLIKNFEKLGE